MKYNLPTERAAQALKATREAANLTQLKLAQLLGVPEIQVSRWETCRAPITKKDGEGITKQFDKFLACLNKEGRAHPARGCSAFEATYRKDAFSDKSLDVHSHPESFSGGGKS